MLHWLHQTEEAIKAYLQGAKLQSRRRLYGDKECWVDVNPIPAWDTKYEYRIKPEPVEVDAYVSIRDSSVVLASSTGRSIMPENQWRKIKMREVT